MQDKFSQELNELLNAAHEFCASEGLAEIGVKELTIALPTLDKVIYAKLYSAIKESAKNGVFDGNISIGRELNKVLALSLNISTARSSKYIDLVDVYSAMNKLGLPEAEYFKNPNQATDVSEDEVIKYLINFNEKAKAGKLDPVIGRSDEITRAMEILSRRSKNNPVLVGEPGVGKTAIIEGLAQKIEKSEVPQVLMGKKIYGLDLTSLISGTKYRGDFEERLKKVIDFAKAHQEIILFIDEIHMLIGAGKTDGAMDAGNILKPALARGEIKCIGATTYAEYSKYIEKDSALERRFQKVQVLEPTVDDTINILNGLKERYEIFHGVEISSEALENAAILSDRYIKERFMPDKAIDLVDEACARVKMRVNTEPYKIEAIKKQLVGLKTQLESAKKSKAVDKIASIEASIASAESELVELEGVYASEKATLMDLQNTRSELEGSKFALEKAQKEGRWDEVGKLSYEVIPGLENKINELAKLELNFKLIRTKVDVKEICEIISRSTGIDVDNLDIEERKKYQKIADVLSGKVFGQDEAVTKVSNVIKRNKAGVTSATRPIGSFLFLGPTGVGKTELSKQVATFIFGGSTSNFTRIDMSEYGEKHSVARLIGSPPGYVGHEDGGQLTERVRRQPYSLILLDEIEKAHPDVLNILLQVLDEGVLTDGRGRSVDFKNTIIILTSNIGAKHIIDTKDFDKAKIKVLEELRGVLKPELLNRLDEVVVFEKLPLNKIKEIVASQMAELTTRLTSRGIQLEYDDSVLGLIADSGYDPDFGARPIKRYIQSNVENIIADRVLADEDISVIKLLNRKGFIEIN